MGAEGHSPAKLMHFAGKLKAVVERLPEPISRPLAKVPFALRLGPGYRRAGSLIVSAEKCSEEMNERFILQKIQALLRHAVLNVEFYRDFYGRHGFCPEDVASFEDIARIPIVTKAELQRVPLEARCARRGSGVRVNTGGTSGEPLEFMIEKGAFAVEWAHMHNLWRSRGYDPQHVKLTLRGKYFGKDQVLRYNAVNNEYVVNANCAMSEVVQAVRGLPQQGMLRWIHGYPSLVAEFAIAIEALPSDELQVFRSRLLGVLLGSEYPAPVYRGVIERVLSTNIVSWYGHSEMAVLARETAEGVYTSYPTYGLAEAVEAGGDSCCRLICSSLHNSVHPFIRYDTGDLIEPVSKAGGALSFRIREGRVGDFVLDRQGKKLALTAIIFGRHHSAFSLARHVQVRDDGGGRITLLVTPKSPEVELAMLRSGFDLGDLDIALNVELVDAPVRTSSGKIQLKVNGAIEREFQ